MVIVLPNNCRKHDRNNYKFCLQDQPNEHLLLPPARMNATLTISTIWLAGVLISLVGFVTFVAWDRTKNKTPWNWFTIASRIGLIFMWWPLLLPMMICFMLPAVLRVKRTVKGDAEDIAHN